MRLSQVSLEVLAQRSVTLSDSLFRPLGALVDGKTCQSVLASGLPLPSP